MAPDASAEDGLLSVLLIHSVNILRCFMLMPKLLKGKHLGQRGVELVKCKSYRLTSHNPMTLHYDGEYGGDVKEIEFKVLPGRLKILV